MSHPDTPTLDEAEYHRLIALEKSLVSDFEARRLALREQLLEIRTSLGKMLCDYRKRHQVSINQICAITRQNRGSLNLVEYPTLIRSNAAEAYEEHLRTYQDAIAQLQALWESNGGKPRRGSPKLTDQERLAKHPDIIEGLRAGHTEAAISRATGKSVGTIKQVRLALQRTQSQPATPDS